MAVRYETFDPAWKKAVRLADRTEGEYIVFLDLDDNGDKRAYVVSVETFDSPYYDVIPHTDIIAQVGPWGQSH